MSMLQKKKGGFFFGVFRTFRNATGYRTRNMSCRCLFCASPQSLYCNNRPKAGAALCFPLMIRHFMEGGQGVILCMKGRSGPFLTYDGLSYATLDEATDSLYRLLLGVSGRRKRVWCNEVWSVNMQNKFSLPLKELNLSRVVPTNAVAPSSFGNFCTMKDPGPIFKYCKRGYFSGDLEHLLVSSDKELAQGAVKRHPTRAPSAAKATKRAKKHAVVVAESSSDEEEAPFTFDIQDPASEWVRENVEKFCQKFPFRAPILEKIHEVIPRDVGNPMCRVNLLHPLTNESVALVLSSSVLLWTDAYTKAADQALKLHRQADARPVRDMNVFHADGSSATER